MCLLSGLSIHEVPRHAEAQDAVVERVVGRQEGCTAESGIHVAHHDEEARALEVHVHVDVNDGVVAQLHVVLAVLLIVLVFIGNKVNEPEALIVTNIIYDAVISARCDHSLEEILNRIVITLQKAP